MDNRNRAEKVLRVFNNIADMYDAANSRISFGMQGSWKNLFADNIAHNSKKHDSVLDVCCGTGDIAIALNKKRKDLNIVGIDFSDSMLEIAKAKSNKKIIWKHGDAMNLPFDDNSFDAACISFGLRNTTDYERVISEMTRVVKNGGFIYCMDSFIPENILILPIYEVYFKYLMPLIGGGFLHRADYNWLYESTKEFITKADLVRLYRKFGIKKIKGRILMFGACILLQGQKLRKMHFV